MMSTPDTFNKIYAVTGPLENTLGALKENLAKNSDDSNAERGKQVQQNLDAVKELNQIAKKIVAAATPAYSSGFGLGNSSASPSPSHPEG